MDDPRPSGAPFRKLIRFPDYDYSNNGMYFLTICTHERRSMFGSISEGVMQLNDWGRIVEEEWNQTGILRPSVLLDAFVVMPNHVHGVLTILNEGHHGSKPTFGRPVAGSLSVIVGAFKSIVTRRINRVRRASAEPVWQPNYYEHVIRNEDDLLKVRDYILSNPAKWGEDKYNPDKVQSGSSSDT